MTPRRALVAAVLAAVVILVGVGVVFLRGRSHDVRVFCGVVSTMNGRDTAAVLASLPPSASNQLVLLTPHERRIVGTLYREVTTALHLSPLASLSADLLDYQVRLHYAHSALQVRNAIDRFHAFTRVSVAQTCPPGHS